MKHLFITGCPRSGTTMLASILGSCKDCVATPESDFFLDFVFKYLNKGELQVKAEQFTSFLNNNYRFKQWAIDAREISLPEEITMANFNGVCESTAKLYAEKHIEKQVTSNLTRIDHTPNNIKYFGILDKMFPKSKLIFIVRDPRAIYSSVKKLDWGANTALRLSNIWIEYVANFYAIQKLYPDKIYLIRYEDVVEKPSEFIADLCKFVQLEYSSKLLEGKGFVLPKYTVSQHNMVGKPLNSTRINKWETQLSEKEIEIIEAKCGIMMNSFGYQCLNKEHLRVGTKEQINSMLWEIYFNLFNRLKKRRREKITS